ncbi:hypothetical protein PSTG_01810 [Puccinia striiformis f. sp. tritici PST-78]|uniref:No apical meristem-associated C-terminal domain-containing protein n=1 Tax=Puccinia striiformis f. sp. tritici PST-78 TaxID=1165861 RepID=A0A0L0W130_9BASI|nr:hypothetical protein PSTG_01810 [Puccinia striiformis f. sp. tritici PST-78]
MVSLSRDPRPQFSESRQFSGSNGLATRLAKGIQGQPNSLNLARIMLRCCYRHPHQTSNQPKKDPRLKNKYEKRPRPLQRINQKKKKISAKTKIKPKRTKRIETPIKTWRTNTLAIKRRRTGRTRKNDDNNLIKDTPKKKNPNWCIEEDKSLCKSWLNTSKDSITGNGQTSDSFWDRIHKLYLGLINKVIEKKKAGSHSKSKGPKGKGFKPFTTRNKKALENRRLRSGSSLDVIAIEAKLLFKNEIGKKFGLDHCWGILHNAQKWLDHLNEANGRKSKNNNNNPSSVGNMSSTTEESRTGRPEGQKTAKKRKNEEITLDELVKGQRELLDISRQKVKSFESYINNMIMCQSLEGMD